MGSGESEGDGRMGMMVRRFRVHGATIEEAIEKISQTVDWKTCSVRLCQPEWWEVTAVIE